jgi:protein MpaA
MKIFFEKPYLAFLILPIALTAASAGRAQEGVENSLEPTPTATQKPVESQVIRVAPPVATLVKELERSEIFGRSVQGRPLRAHVLGEGPEVTFIFAAVHGNETATPYQVEQLRAHLKRHPELLRNRRVVLVPVVNPDGLQVKSRLNARGVDINRNYPGSWRRPRRGERFRPGSSAASEPETQAMIRLTNKYRPHKIVSIHQPLHCVTYSGQRSRTLARVIAGKNGYPLKTSIGYPTPGGFGAYCNLILKTAVVTLELPWQSPQAAWRRNAPALLAAIAFPQARG